jgi:membrane protein DedA with SNARE-associated domain
MWNKIAIAFFYNTIKGFIKQFIGGFGLAIGVTIPDDLIMAVIGWLIMDKTKYKAEGEALLLSAVASLGATTGVELFGRLFGGAPAGGQTQQTQTATTMAYEVIR